ncbi:hypothetical protein HHK36_022504 [Tetracentron sinense]|uniref:glutathione gamma-glutamylcysteinyltransferase n=1 Tax=Tetracentron sinense TaxID=13715 RepID=A0A835D8W5_TETSI|nr:hypothetical protein HHK36_022504 [Tetracentron sinense]
MAMAGFYRRVLPSPPAIEFASPDGKEAYADVAGENPDFGYGTRGTQQQLFTEALQKGNMEGFFKLISYYQTQSEPAYCGLASLSMVLNALAIDPGRKWKGPWRWFDESMLDCCEPLEKIKAKGITFGKVACLAHCNGAQVESFRTNQSTIDDFRKYVITCTSSEDCHMITSYHRGIFKQTGTGHFSPIGGYHGGSDMVLILDVARFKHPAHWVPLTLLWEAMDTVDEATGHLRGFMLISRLDKAPSLLYTLSCRHESWVRTAKYLIDHVPLILKTENVKDVEEVLSILFTPLLANFTELIKWIAEIRRQEDGDLSLSKEERGRLAIKEEVLKQVQETELFKHVTEWLSCENSYGRNIPPLDKDTLPEIAANDFCQGAELLTGKLGSSCGFYCGETSVTRMKANGDMPVTVVSGTLVSGGNEQGVDMLVPLSQAKPNLCCSDPSDCIVTHPASNDVLTVLLLALPPHTWSGIKEDKLLMEIRSIVSTENLPPLLQEEVLHLQRQLHFLMTDLGVHSAS